MPTAKKKPSRRKPSPKRNPSNRYEVIVGNIGTIFDETGGARVKWNAKKAYLHYVEASLAGTGRVGGEGVVLMEDGEIIAEHFGENDGD